MSERDYYPAGAYDDPNAPYNQPDLDPIQVDTEVSISLSHSNVPIYIDDYIEEPWEDWDTGDEGEIIHNGGIDYNFNDTNFEKDYLEDDLCIIKLLEEYAKILENNKAELIRTRDNYKSTLPNDNKVANKVISIYNSKIKAITNKINACRNWIVDDIHVEQS